MSAEELAEILNGNQIGNEITGEQSQQAKSDGLVVVFGYSDDNIEFRGSLCEEFGCYGGGQISFTKEGKEIDEDDLEVLEKYNAVPPLNVINAIWNDIYQIENVFEHCSWQYKTEIPHSTFRVIEDGELFCVGIVFSIGDLK